MKKEVCNSTGKVFNLVYGKNKNAEVGENTPLCSVSSYSGQLYNSNKTYNTGEIALEIDDNNEVSIYISLIDNNTNDLTDISSWKKVEKLTGYHTVGYFQFNSNFDSCDEEDKFNIIKNTWICTSVEVLKDLGSFFYKVNLSGFDKDNMIILTGRSSRYNNEDFESGPEIIEIGDDYFKFKFVSKITANCGVSSNTEYFYADFIIVKTGG
jgi:hypothetical protein